MFGMIVSINIAEGKERALADHEMTTKAIADYILHFMNHYAACRSPMIHKPSA